MLNCVCIYTMKKTHKCYDEGETVEFAAKRLSADAWSTIINDYYNRPTPEHPYFYIHNLEGQTDMKDKYNVNAHQSEGNGVTVTNTKENSNFPREVIINGQLVSTVEKETAYRYGNASKVRCEIRYGKDDSIYQLTNVYIDYIKVPQVIRLTKSQLDYTEDTSQIMEFPDYVCQEIINELVILVMQRDADPRLQTQMAVSQSIAQPAQAQTPQRSNS